MVVFMVFVIRGGTALFVGGGVAAIVAYALDHPVLRFQRNVKPKTKYEIFQNLFSCVVIFLYIGFFF